VEIPLPFWGKPTSGNDEDSVGEQRRNLLPSMEACFLFLMILAGQQ
jgi:hypothetical protein